MDEFILKEKHEYWDNKITLEEYIKDTEESGYIDCTGNLEYEFWYILENLKKINNLQSKIDKAIELGDKIIQEYEEVVGLTGNLVFNFKQVLNILKENK